MIYPFLQIEHQQLYDTLISDRAKNFHIRFVESMSVMYAHYKTAKQTSFLTSTMDDELAELKNEFSQGVLSTISELNIPPNTILVFGHNVQTPAIKDVLSKGLSTRDGMFPIYSSVISMLTAFKIARPRMYEIALLDVIQENGTPLSVLPIKARVESLRAYLGNLEYTYHLTEQDHFAVRVPNIISASINEVGQKIETLIEDYGSMYHHIEIFGNQRYAIRNPYLSMASASSGVNLFPTLTTNIREYQQHDI